MSGEGNSKLTEPRVTAALEALRGGCTRRAAAGYAHIHPATFYRWMDDDATFRDEVEKAEAEAEAHMTAAVALAVPKNWQAAAWWLERRRFEDYARRERVDMSIDLRKEAERIAQESGLNEKELVDLAERIAQGRG